MNLTKDKLKSLVNNKLKNDRFDILDELITEILDNKNMVTLENNITKIGSDEIKYKNSVGNEIFPTKDYFGPSKDNMTVDRAYSGVAQMSEKFHTWKEIANKIGCILGGFDFTINKMEDKFRIISNTITGKDDYYGTLTSQGQSRHPSSHFADNNYFFNIMDFIQKCVVSEEPFENSTMVLRYPSHHLDGQFKSKFFVENDDIENTKEYNKQKEVLSFRFPPKFLWMWAKKDTVIHPISLMAFRRFINTTYGKEILKSIDQNYTPESITNMKFDDFTKAWQNISNKILKDLEINEMSNNDSRVSAIANISKLISIIMIEETDIKNISDLLSTGNKAVILWGPPGTGKTYESMEVVKELLKIDEDSRNEDIENKYLFSKQLKFEKNQGCYEIIQFHPNYTYEDFIGGISPKIDAGNVSYELRQGVFYKFCKQAEQNSEQKYIFIIDEINRAELSAVFGELLFALEYRGKHISLPHFGSFTIPTNVYIIGTMNNVDKSLVTFDLALRRRFGFFKLMPKLDVIADVLTDKVEFSSLEKYVIKCKQLNILISKSGNQIKDNDSELINKIKDHKKYLLELGEDYQIGQAYFLKIKDFLSDEENLEITSFDLEKLWVYNIEPLLEEYLGMSMEDEGIKDKLYKLKKFFVEDE